MRLLAVGYALPHPDIDNYNVLTAPSYFDYNAVMVDPISITRVVKEAIEEGAAFEAFDGRPVVNAPTTASAVAIADQVRRRGEETQRLLESGGLLVVVARPNATIGGVVGFEGCDRYSWLPAPAGVSWGHPFLRPAEGKTIRVIDDQHPLATMLRTFRSEFGYRATLDDRQAPLRQAGRVIAVGGAAVPIAMEFRILAGRVVFIPAPGDSVGAIRAEIAEAMVGGCRQLLGAEGMEEAPYWSRSIPVPGLEQVEAELEEADAAAAESTARAAATREGHDLLAAHRRLLWAEGVGFTAAVGEALRLLGFAVTSPAGEPLVIESEGRQALVECEGSREQVVEWPYVRLQRRLEERLLKSGEQPGGVAVVNGFRGTDPPARGQQYTDALRNACDNYRYTLLTGETLFSLVQRALGGADEATLTGIRRRVLAGRGLLAGETALGEVEEGKDAGPIF